MARPAAKPFQYQSPTDPNFHTGIVAVTGSSSINLGIGHSNFMFLATPEGDYDVTWSKASGARRGQVDVVVKEAPYRQVVGGLVSAPTSASTQATGAGATVWRVNVGAWAALLGESTGEAAAVADTVIHDTTQYTGLANGKSAIAAIVIKNDAGTVSLAVVKGTAATTGSQVTPTDAEIQTAVGAAVKWLRITDCTLNRTADTTVTQSQNNKVRFTGRNSQSAVNVNFVAISRGPGGA